MTSLARNERRRTAKRGNGEGSIYLQTSRRTRKDGVIVERVRYAAAVTLDDGKRKVLYGKTRQQVADRLSAALSQQKQGVPFTPDRLTVERYLAEWLEQSAKPKLKPSTYRTYRMLMERHVLPAIGKYPLTKLTPHHVQKLLNDRQASGLKPRSVQQIHAVLRSALNRAVKWQLVTRNVATLVDVPRAPATDIKPLVPAQADVFLSAARGHRYGHLYAFLLSTGLRLGEALALRWHDDDGTELVDLDGRRANVRYTLERVRGQPWRFAQPKSDSGRRTVPLTAPALAALRAQRRRTAEMRLQSTAWQDFDLVFPSAAGTPLDGTNVYHAFKQLLKAADLPSSHRVHDLRHSTATYLLAARVDPRIVMAVMGWSQASMLTRYQHVLPAMLDDTATRLEAILPTSYLG